MTKIAEGIELEGAASAAGAASVAAGSGGVNPAASLEPPFADGVYFGLPETPYHADPALGSTDVRRLYENEETWWWHSHFNPVRPPDKPTAYKEFGSAVHKFVLEGREAFDGLYQREYEGDDLLKTVDDLKTWLKERGNSVPSKAVKADIIEHVLALDPDAKIDDNIKRVAAEQGKTILPAEMYDRALVSGTLISKNPDLENAFQGGAPEVSVFWTEEINGVEVRCKARFDYLKIRGIGDLKSTANQKQIEFSRACTSAMADWRMDIQAAHYLHGRAHLAQLVADGCVHGEHDADWLAKVAAQKEYGFAFVFFQSQGAPSTWATALTPGNPILEVANSCRSHALDKYVTSLGRFGSEMWLKREPLAELDVNDLPAWWGRR